MKLNEKLQKLRKENNITQEGLADKLKVSRQAVSKWESGVAYPDTEKLIQISKIFNISLDDLVNDNSDKKFNSEVRKFSFMDILNNSLEFISNAVNMFWSMRFVEKIKFLFEMMVLVFIVSCVAVLSTSIIVNLIRRIFMFMPSELVYGISSIFELLLFLVWLVLGIIIVVKIFKTRYLDYYVFTNSDRVLEQSTIDTIKELKEEKEYRIVIRDPKDSSLNMIKMISKICIFLVKCLCFLLVIPLILFFIFCIVMFVLSLFYIFDGLFFNGISICVLGIILFIYLLIEFIYNTIFNRKHAVNRIFILFIISVSIIGIGLGLSIFSLSNFSYEDNYINEVNTHLIDIDDKIVLDFMNYEKNNIVIDNELDKIKLEVTCYNGYNAYLYSYNIFDGYKNNFKVYDIGFGFNELEFYKYIIDNFKEQKIVNYDDKAYDVKIYLSEDNLKILKRNLNEYNGYTMYD